MRNRVTHRRIQRKKFVSPNPLPFAWVYDNFTGTNDTSLASRNPPVRLNSNSWTVPQGSYAINNNRLEARFPSSGQAVATFDTGFPDAEMKMVIRLPATGTGRVAGFTFRYTSNSDRWSAVIAQDNSELRIIETTGGTSTTRKFLAVSPQSGVDYNARLLLQGDRITFSVDGLGSIDYESSVGNTRTRHGLRANQAVSGAVIIFDEFLILPAPDVSDVVATISPTPLRTARTHISISAVDNNHRTDFAGATAQKNLMLTNLAGKAHNLNMFIESFGNGTTLGSWNGTSNLPADMPQPNLTGWKASFDILDAALDPDTWGIYGHRLPYQLTGNTADDGITVKSTSATYNQENRRLLTDKVPQYIEWVARWSSELMLYSPKIRTFFLGSEGKGFQTVVKVEVDGVVIRADRNQSWDWDDYAGTPGRADMGFFAYFEAFREGIIEGATRANVALSDITVVSPYPVISHQGSLADGGSADAVRTNTRNDWLGSPVDTSDINGNATYPGWPNVAAIHFTFEHVRLMQEKGYSITAPKWRFGIDYGTFSADNQPYNLLSDHDIAFNRVMGMETFVNKSLEKYGFVVDEVERGQPEYYAKAMNPMDVAGLYFIDEELRDDYQGSIRGVWLIACYLMGIDFPDQWSFYGRGDQSYIGGNDPNQWYGGLVVRPVSSDSNHSSSVPADGGTALAALAMVDGLKTHFPPGTEIYEMEFNTPFWRGMASDTHAFIVNESGQTKTLSIGSGTSPVTFQPYEVKVVVRP